MKRSARTAVIGVFLAAALAACAGADRGAGGSTGSTGKLIMRQFDPAAEIQGLQAAVDTWNKQNPDTQVELQTLSPANVQQFAREANGGSGPDINVIGYTDVNFLAKPKILLPLDDLMKSAPLEGSASDLLATDMVTFDKKMWALPWTADTFALAYRPDALKAAGVAAPPTTWEALASDAAKISSSSGGKTAGFCFAGAGSPTSSQWFAINYYLWSKGSGLIEKDSAGKQKPKATTQQLTSAIDYFAKLFTTGATPKSFQAVDAYTDPSIVGGLASGSCAMSYLPPQTLRSVEKQAPGKVLTAPMPDGTTDGATHLGGRALGINANTKNPEGAWKVLRFLASATTFSTYDQYPASKSTLAALKVPESEKGFVLQLPHSQSFGRYIGSQMTIASIVQLVNQQFSSVYSGQTSSSAAAQAIVDGLTRGTGG